MNLALSLGTERPEMQRGEGPAAGDPGLHLPVPGPAAWHLMTPPPGAEWRVAPRGLTHALCERPPLRGQARGERDWVPSRGNRGPSPGGHTRCGRRTSPGRLRHDTGSDTCRGRDRHLGGSAVCRAGAEGGAGGGSLPCRRWGSASPSFRFASSHASSNAVLAWRPSEAVRVTTTCQTHCKVPCKPWRAKTGSYVRGAGFPLLPLALGGEQQAVCTSRALPELGAVPPCFLRAAGSPDGSHRQDAESSAQHRSSRKPGKRPLSIMAFSRNKESIKGVFFTEHP